MLQNCLDFQIEIKDKGKGAISNKKIKRFQCEKCHTVFDFSHDMKKYRGPFWRKTKSKEVKFLIFYFIFSDD